MLMGMGRCVGSRVFTRLVGSSLGCWRMEINIDSGATKVRGPYSSKEQRHLWREANGYYEPAVFRYFDWLAACVVGDFGESGRFKAPVSDVLWPRLGNTGILGGLALVFASAIGLTVGVIAGMREGGLRDRVASVSAILTTSVPEFATAVFLLSLFVFQLQWLPGTSGMANGFDPLRLVDRKSTRLNSSH